MRFSKKGKLAKIYINHFEVFERINMVEYKLGLPSNMNHINNLFHISLLSKYMGDPSRVLRIEGIELP